MTLTSIANATSGSSAYEYYDAVLLEYGDTYGYDVPVYDETPQGIGVGGGGVGFN
jgi:hypothetical protein